MLSFIRPTSSVKKVTANTISKTAEDMTFEMRGFGCPGQKGERYLLQRIAYIGPWELQVTYAPMEPDRQPASCREAAGPQAHFFGHDNASQKLTHVTIRAHPGFSAP